jgi:hypothetical protein
MMAQPQTPPLRPFNGGKIPRSLKDQPRWAPWKAVWNAKRGKYDKIPHRADMPAYGISTARPDNWFAYDTALATLNANPGTFNGLGFVLTGIKGWVGIDLDNCIANGTIEPWAQEIIDQARSYTEISPSGNGLRIFLTGEQPDDWMNHDRGIEVYGGKDARFLTVSGDHISTTPLDVAPADSGMLADLESRYAKTRTRATIIDLQMPELLAPEALPALQTLELPQRVVDFLLTGSHDGDGSGILHQAGIALYVAGLSDAEVFSTLVGNAYSMEVALRHRHQDSDRAVMYLWREQCLKTKPKAASRVASPDDFDDVSTPQDRAAGTSGAAKAKRFEFQQAAQYLKRKPVSWLVKRVLPHADVGAVFGESGAGKSFLVLDLIMAIATGTKWMGHDVAQGTVAYVCAEGAGGFTTRLEAYAEHYLTDLALIPIHVLGDAPNFLEKTDIKDLVAAVRALGPVSVIVVDTLAQVTAGANENSGEDMGRALAHCKALAMATGAMVLLVAHAGKDSARGLRGWSGIKGALDVEILVERADDFRAATITKMKDGEGEGTEYPFKLETVILRQDADGDDVTSCVVKAGKAIPKGERKGDPKGVWQQTVYRVARTLTDLDGAPTATQLLDGAVAEMPAEEGKRDRRRELATRALEALVAANRVSLVAGTVNLL